MRPDSSPEMGRPAILAMLGVGLAALLAAGAFVAWSRWAASAPDEWPHAPLATDKSLGVNADLSPLDAAAREEALTAMEAAGFRWLRQRFPWEAIEPEQDVYDWAPWDDLVEDVARHNIRLIAVLDGSPSWARTEADAENPLAPPRENRDFGDFVAAFAARYGDRVDHYQVWDEPNIAPHWGAREIDPAAYARLLREGAIRLRAADPGAIILAAALAPNVESGGANMSEWLFLDALYQQGAAEWFDVAAAQPYAFSEPLSAPPDPDRLNWQRASLLRGVIEAHGDAGTAVWAVSFGATPPTAEVVAGAVEQTRLDWPWLGPMLWAAWSPADAHGEYALTDADGRPGPIQETLRSLAASPVVAWPGVYPADHPSGIYEGDWRVTPSGADIGGNGDRLTIPFRGTRLDLVLRRGDYRAFLFVTVDGEAANALPRDAEGRAYVVLYDPLLETDTVTLARDLPDGAPGGEHVAEIVAERGWGQWAIVGWTVSREAARGLPWLAVALGLAALIPFSLAICLFLPRRHLLRPKGVLLSGLAACDLLLARYHALDERLALVVTAGAAILLYGMAGTLPTLAALALLGLLLLLRPESGLPLIALALPFYQLGRPLLGKVFSMVEILTLLTAVGWGARVAGNWVSGNRESGIRDRGIGDQGSGIREAGGTQRATRFTFHVSHFTTLDWGVLALVMVGAVSLLWAEHGRVAAREFRVVVLESAIFYGLLRAMVRDRRGMWRVADAWVLGGALIALVGVVQWAFGQNTITAEGVWRVRGFYGSPNNLALYLGKVFPLTVAIAAFVASSPLAGGTEGRRRWLYGLAALLMAAALFLTYSRGAWIVGVPVSLLFLAAMRGRRVLTVAAGVLVVAAVVLLLAVGAGRLTSLLDTTEGTTFFRLQLWQSSWAMVRDHPVLGVGLDNFLYYYRTHYVLPTAWEEFNLSHPHNLVFDFWLRLGLPGLVVLIWLLVGFLKRAWRAYRRLPESYERLLVLGLMAGLVNFVAHGLVDNAFFLVDLAFVFMLMLALVQSIRFAGWADRSANSANPLLSSPYRPER